MFAQLLDEMDFSPDEKEKCIVDKMNKLLARKTISKSKGK